MGEKQAETYIEESDAHRCSEHDTRRTGARKTPKLPTCKMEVLYDMLLRLPNDYAHLDNADASRAWIVERLNRERHHSNRRRNLQYQSPCKRKAISETALKGIRLQHNPS